LIEEARVKNNLYLNDRIAFMDSLHAEAMMDDSMTLEMEDAKLKKWTIENSPSTYIHSFKGQAIIKGVRLNGDKHTISIPQAKINGKDTKWYDKNFAKIESNPDIKAYYDFYKESMEFITKSLPISDMSTTPENFVPNIKKSFMESFAEKGMTGVGSGVWENFVDVMTSHDNNTASADRNVRTGAVNKRIPVRFLSKISAEDKSRDLAKSLEVMTLMALGFKHRAKVENDVLILQEAINSAAVRKVNSKGELMHDAEGKIFEETGSQSLIKQQANESIDFTLYGIKRNPGENTGIVLGKDAKSSVEATQLNKKIKLLNEKLKMGLISKEDYSLEVNPLNERLTEIDGQNVTTADIADGMMHITQLKGMGYNITSSINNMTFGLISNITHAAGGADFSIKQSLAAYRIMLSSTAKSLGSKGTGSAMKVNALSNKFDTIDEVNDAAYGSTSKSKSKLKFGPYELQRRSEYFVQNMNMVAMMLNTKVKNLKGVETSLWEAYDDKGEWKTEEYGENKDWDGDINNEHDLKKHKAFRNKLKAVNSRVHGNYDPNDLKLAKKTVLGRFGLQFKSWLPEAVATRFEPATYDENLGRWVKGSWRTVGHLGFMGTLKAFAKIATRSKTGLNHLSPVDQENVKKAFSELSWYLTIIMAGIVASGLGDDDEEKSIPRTLLLNQLNRLQGDVEFFMSPSSIKRTISDPVAAIKVYTDATKAIGAAVSFVVQDEEDKGITGEEATLKIMKAFPVLNQVPSTISAGAQVYRR